MDPDAILFNNFTYEHKQNLKHGKSYSFIIDRRVSPLHACVWRSGVNDFGSRHCKLRVSGRCNYYRQPRNRVEDLRLLEIQSTIADTLKQIYRVYVLS